MKEAKSPESDEGTTFVKADPGHQSLIQLISKLTEGWGHASVRISSIAGFPSGGRSKRITIILDAATSEPSETTSSTKS